MPAALYDLSLDLSEQKSILKDEPDVKRHLETLLDDGRKILGDTLADVKGGENRKPGFSENPVNPKVR